MTSIAERIARERGLVGAKQLRYSLDFARDYHRWYNTVLLGLLPPDGAFTVLDGGCGTGVLLPQMRRRFSRTVGLDLCLENLLAARALDGDGPLLVGDIEHLPVAAESLDHIVCRGVLYRLTDVGRGLQQLFAALKPGGHLVIAEPIADSRAIRWLRHAALATGTHPFHARQIEYLTSRQWISAAEIAGFHTARWFHLGYLAFPLLGFPEALPLMRWVPGRMGLARVLLGLDRLIARTPGIRRCAWQAVFHFRKPLASS